MLERLFGLKEHETTVKRELVAGLTSFSTMAYALLLIPTLLSAAGMDLGSALMAMIITGAYATLMMGLLANYPFILAPGVALCVYFTYSVVLGKGYDWRMALGLVFLTGVFLLALNLLRIRQLIIQAIPYSLRLATTGGLGLFLALVGLKNAGIIVSHPHNFITFGDPSSVSHVMTAVGLIAMAALMRWRVPGAIFLGVLLVWIVSLIFGLAEWKGLVAWPSSMLPTLFQLDVRAAFHIEHLGVLISFLFVALFDSTGTLVGLAEEGNYLIECPKEQKRCIFPRVSRALMPDTTGSLVASVLGATPVAVYVESAAGIEAGGRTGLTAVTAGLLFLLALFFAPFVSSIPMFATAPALVLIGGLMLRPMSRVDWEDPSEWVPAFTTLILVPLTYSIATGIAVGYIIYCLIKLFTFRVKEVHWLSWILAALFILKFIFFPND